MFNLQSNIFESLATGGQKLNCDYSARLRVFLMNLSHRASFSYPSGLNS